MSRIALIADPEGGYPGIVTDDAEMQVYSVDEGAPDDRVFLFTTLVKRVTPKEFDALIAGEVHRAGDKPIQEQAVRAMLDRKPNGKPNLSVVEPTE